MRRCLPIFFIVANFAGLAAGPRSAAADVLGVGDPAPPMAVAGWLKGEKVEEFEPGKTYVIQFWATWCGPSLASIPHLTELAHHHRGVRFVGVDVWEEDTKLVAPFVEKMGDQMDYSVALDASQGLGARNGLMSRTWLNAAAEAGLPTAFIVHDGKIAWIANPMAIDEPLAKIAAGEWDLAPLVRRREEARAEQRRLAALQAKVYNFYRAGDYKATLAAIDEAAAGDPEWSRQFVDIQYTALWQTGAIDAALAAGDQLVEKYKGEGMALNNLFFYAVDLDLKDAPDPRIARQALKALRLADDLTGNENLMIVDSLAVALYRTGDPAAALATQQKALKVLEATVPNRSHPYYKLFEGQIARFRKAAEEKAPGP